MSRTRRTYHQPPRDPDVARLAKLAAEAYMAALPPEDPEIQALRRRQMDAAIAADSRWIRERTQRLNRQRGEMTG